MPPTSSVTSGSCTVMNLFLLKLNLLIFFGSALLCITCVLGLVTIAQSRNLAPALNEYVFTRSYLDYSSLTTHLGYSYTVYRAAGSSRGTILPFWHLNRPKINPEQIPHRVWWLRKNNVQIQKYWKALSADKNSQIDMTLNFALTRALPDPIAEFSGSLSPPSRPLKVLTMEF